MVMIVLSNCAKLTREQKERLNPYSGIFGTSEFDKAG